jgi:hypothetical protein
MTLSAKPGAGGKLYNRMKLLYKSPFDAGSWDELALESVKFMTRSAPGMIMDLLELDANRNTRNIQQVERKNPGEFRDSDGNYLEP